MKRFLLSVFIFCLSLSIEAQTKVIAHRGFWDTENSAQNSITSLYKASEAGCYGAEFDVQMTVDGKLIVYHDNEMLGKKIFETPYDSLREYRLSNGEILPTLEQYLIHARNCPKIKLILEIKTPEKISDEKIKQLVVGVLDMVRKYDLPSRTEYIAFNADVCKEVRELKPDAPVYYLGENATPTQLSEWKLTGLDYHYKKFSENPLWIEEAHKAGLKVNVWTVNEATMMREMIDLGVDFITTDKPLLLKEILQK